MNLIYINSGITSVFSSQVLALLTHFKQSGTFSSITLLFGVRNKKERSKAQKLIEKSGITTIYFTTLPNYAFFNFIQKKIIKTAIAKIVVDQKTVFHIRGEHLAYLSSSGIQNAVGSLSSTLVDIRGASLEEFLEFGKANPILQHFKIRNINRDYDHLDRYGAVSAVSESLKNYISAKTQQKVSKIYVTPCLAGEKYIYSENIRTEYRQKLQLEPNEKLFVFVNGGMRPWQNDIVVKEIGMLGFKILNLSQVNLANKNIVNLFVPYDEVPNYLNASDIALLYRTESIVNKVSSPVKFSEYVCSGLPVITNNCVDQISDFIKDTEYGCVINDIQNISKDMVSTLTSKPRMEISNYARNIYGIEAVSMKYLNIYYSFRSPVR